MSNSADPGFPRPGAATFKGAPTCYLAHFFRKMHENEDFLANSGRYQYPLPFGSATVAKIFFFVGTTTSTIQAFLLTDSPFLIL